MATEIISLNKENWSGEEGTIEIDRTACTFKIHDCVFKLEPIEVDYDDEQGYRIVSADGNWAADASLGSVWVEANGTATALWGDLVREAKDPYVAAAKLLYNTI